MSQEATLYIQMLVGLNGRSGQKHVRDDVVALARKYGFDSTIPSVNADPVITQSAMVSEELLGIWRGNIENSVLVLQILPVDPQCYRAGTENFRALAAAVLRELDQVSVYWFPALRRPMEDKFQFELLKAVVIFDADKIEFPDPRYVFGRSVTKTLSIIRGPPRFGKPSFVVYKSDWDGTPLFIPNTDWTPPLGELRQNDLIEKGLRERYPFVDSLQMRITREAEWRCIDLKKTGDSLKATVFGEDAAYTFQFAIADVAGLTEVDPNAEFNDIKRRPCCFRTVDELIADSSTVKHNHQVLKIIKDRLGVSLGI